MTDRHSPVSEQGFTLIELIIGITVGGIVMGAIVLAFNAGFRITDEANTRIGHSNNRHIVAAYFVNDVQSALGPGVSTSTCSSGGTTIMSFQSTDTVTGSTSVADQRAVHVTYAYNAGTLQRRECRPPDPPKSVDVATMLTSPPRATCPQPERCILTLTDESGTYTLEGTRRSP